MPVYYDTDAGEVAVAPESCPDCGTGCDVDFINDGWCARAIADESDEERQDRFNTERAAFGLPPL